MSGIVIAIGPDAFTTPGKIFNSISGTVTIGSGGRNGGNAVAVANNSNANTPLPAPLGELWIAFDIVTDALNPAGNETKFLSFNDGGSSQVEARFNSAGVVHFYRGASTLIATSSGFAVAPATHYHFEVHLKVHASAGLLDFWVNEIPVTLDNSTGLNTKATANSTVDNFGLLVSSTVSIKTNKFRDIIVRDDQQVGNKRVREDLPTGTGSIDDGVPGGSSTQADTRQSVDEADPNDGVDYAALQNVGDKFLLTYPAIPTDSLVIGVAMRVSAALSAAGSGKYKPAYKVGATNALGTEIAPSNGSYAYATDTFLMQSPDTAADWTPTEVNSSEFGAERTL